MLHRHYKRVYLPLFISFTAMLLAVTSAHARQSGTGNATVIATDTLSHAKQLNAIHKYAKSVKLLASYYNNHPGNLNAQWLYAQTLYFNKHLKKSQAVYEYAIKWHPENYYLRLDYAKKLVEEGELSKALPTLNLYLAYDSTATDVHLALAKIDLWQGDYKNALKEIAKVQKKDAKSTAARDLKAEILAAQSSWIKISGGYYADNQPMQKITTGVEAGVYIAPLADLRFNLCAPVTLANSSAYNWQWLQAGNIFHANKIGFQLELDAGIIRLPTGKFSYTGNLELNQTFVKHLVLTAKVEHKAYLYALANLTDPVMELHYNAALAWVNKNSWQGRIAFDADQFYSDNNIVLTGSGWIMTPPLKASVFEFRIGYGYNYSTSLQNRYASVLSVAQITAAWDSAYKIPGAYNPYFTPYKQSVNSAILSINIHPAKIVDIGLKGNIGFYATTENPYLFLNKNSADETVITTGYERKVFLPGDANAYVAVQITPRINLKAEYKFFATNFYTSNYGGLALQINFWNDRKRQ